VRSACDSDEAKYYRFSPRLLESESLRDSLAFFVLDQNISTWMFYYVSTYCSVD
jgi:hypothetical protein